MSGFPLFESLYNDTKEKHGQQFPDEHREYVLNHIPNLDENGREIFYAIIRQDHVQRYPSLSNELPSFCKQLKSGIRIEFDDIPNSVKYMLYEFINRHLKKITEDAMFFKRKDNIEKMMVSPS